MSYCRWSSDNFNCDLYIYESTMGGYDLHVANFRYLKDGTLEKIGLSYDGESFNFTTITELIEFIQELISLGYRVPNYVIPTLEQENEQ